MAALPRGKRHVSRHKKKHWRKHTDIRDIEEHLEEQRFEERTGGLVETRPDDILYFEDKKKPLTKEDKKKLNCQIFCMKGSELGDEPILCDRYAVEDVPQEVSAVYQLKQSRKHTGLQCYRLLQPAPYPKAVAVPKQTKRLKQLTPIRQEQENEKLKKWLKVAPPLPRQPIGESVPQAWIPEDDAWGDVGEKPAVVERKKGMRAKNLSVAPLDMRDDYYVEIIDFYKQQTKQKPIKVPNVRYVKPSGLPSVEVPLPGASYNPAFDDYQHLIEKAAAVEIKKQKEDDHLNRVLIQKFPTKAEAPTQATWLLEMSQGLCQEGNSIESDEDLQDLITSNPATRCDRKLRSKRRREEQQKIIAEMSVEEKMQRKRESDIYRIKKLKSEIQAADALSAERQAKRQTRNAAKHFLPAKLSQHKYEAPDIEVQLSTELSSSLRLMKPEGCLAEDRLKSFQRRNIIEPRVRQNVKRKYKPKRYTRKSHKESTT